MPFFPNLSLLRPVPACVALMVAGAALFPAALLVLVLGAAAGAGGVGALVARTFM